MLVPYSAVMTKLKAFLVSLLMTLGLVAAVQTPALAALNCEPNGATHLFCLYRSWDYTLNQPAVWSEGFFDSNPRNTCLVVATADDAAYFNDTRFVWYGYNTTTCNGSRAGTYYPHTAGQLFPTGGRHAVMRTALLG